MAADKFILLSHSSAPVLYVRLVLVLRGHRIVLRTDRCAMYMGNVLRCCPAGQGCAVDLEPDVQVSGIQSFATERTAIRGSLLAR